MPEQPKTPDAVDAAIAAATQQPMAKLSIGLPNGRQASVEFPIPLSPEEVVRITGAFQTAYLQQFDAEKAQTRPSGLVIPGRPA